MYKGCKGIDVELQDKILVIKFNNPKKRNCVNQDAYETIGRLMRQVANDEAITLVVFTGVGDYYSAGNDLLVSPDISDIEAYFKKSKQIFTEFVESFIDCPKAIVALVNGPCIGIAATLAALSDLVWCEENAYFLTPFAKLGIIPEACSTYLFPLILGRSKANEMLLFGDKLTAQEALHYNFASRIFKLSELYTTIWPKLREYAQFPRGALLESKKLMRAIEKENMYKALHAETDALYKRLQSEEFAEALFAFANRKKKAKL